MLLSVAELEQSSLPIPEVQQFLEAHPAPPFDWNDTASIRAGMSALEAAAASALPPAPDIEESSLAIPMRDGFTNVAKIRKPASSSAPAGPLVVLAFGGGFCGGSNEQMGREARALVRVFGAVVVNLSYRLSPEYKFPVPVQDAWDGLGWLAARARELGADPSKGFVMGGESAGATATAMCARKAQVEPLAHPLTGQWLCSPSALRPHQVPQRWRHLHLSLDHNRDAPVLPVAAMDALQKQGGWDWDSPWRLPLNMTHPLAGLPKAYTQANGMDPLRDDGLLYDEVLKEAGVDTRSDFYPGTPHVHTAFLLGAEVTKKALLDLVVGFGWMLDQSVTRESAAKALDLV